MMRRLAVGAPIISKSIQSTTSLETLKGSNMRFNRLITMRLASKILSLCALLVATCEGPVGPNGPTGTPGPVGTDPLSCEPSATGLHAELSLSPPAQGAYYKTGEAPQLTIRLLSGCQKLVAPSDLGTANLYLVGPRGALTTRSANQLLNAVTDRAAKDRQHHFINLKSPSYANPSAGGLKIAQDGTLLFRPSPVRRRGRIRSACGPSRPMSSSRSSRSSISRSEPRRQRRMPPVIRSPQAARNATRDRILASCTCITSHRDSHRWETGRWINSPLRHASCATTKTVTVQTQPCARFTQCIAGNISCVRGRRIRSMESRPMLRWRSI